MRTYRTIVVAGVPIKLYGGPGLFAKGELDKGTQLLIENLELPITGVVLDLACGNGIIGIYIALLRRDLKVYMSDVDARAVELARLNTKINNVEDRTVVVISNVYEKEVLIINNLYKEKTNKTTHHWAFFLFIEFFKK